MASETGERPQALVTGASSGIGAAFAERLAHDGFDIILVARRRDKLEEIAQRLHTRYPISVKILVADLSNSVDVHRVEKCVAEAARLELLVNNAGFGAYMRFVELEPEQAEALLSVKVVSVVRLTRAALTGMLSRGRGSIINVSSKLAFSRSFGSTYLPKRATYAGANAFLNTFSQLLQSELEGTGVQVQALCPGVVETEFHDLMGIDRSRFPAAIVMSPEDVVQASLMGLRLGEVICVPSMEDAILLSQIEQDERRLFDSTGTGELAGRYR